MRATRIAAVLSTALFFYGCDEAPLSPAPLSPDEADRTLASPSSHGVITTNADTLAAGIRAAGNDNEIIVVLRVQGDPAPGFEPFLEHADRSVIGIPAHADQRRATLRRPNRPGAAERAQLLELASQFEVEPYLSADRFTFMAMRIPDDKLERVVAALLRHPNVDYVQANERRPLTPSSGSQIDVDEKHLDHHVQAAWTYTRGSGARIGIMDSGFAYDFATSTFHPDGQSFGTYGIIKLGFADDLGGCTSDGQQSQGICTPWDDHTYVQYPYQGGHGTAMTGLVGANDNSFGRQGIAPEATVYSLKISFNTYPSGRGTCGGVESTFCVEDDDILAALNWATYNNLDVLSMSFAGYGAPAIMDALDDAYNYGDVLLLSALGNSEEDDPDYYSANGSVMGVASVDADGNYRRFINLEYREVSASEDGGTTRAECTSHYNAYCTVASNTSGQYWSYYGGTSTSTANAAAVAGLLRAYNPSLSASEARSRLRQSTWGPTKVIDADWAIRGVYYLWLAPLSGESWITSPESYQWSTYATGGEGGYSYTWALKAAGSSTWTNVGTGTSYQRYVSSADSDFDLRVTVTSAGRTYWRYFHVSVVISGDDCVDEFGKPLPC